MKKTLLLLLLLPFCFAAAAEGAIDRAWVERNYRKTEYRIPMRDGVRLHTTVYAPCDTAGRHPILLTRTPYSCRPYGAEFSASLWKSFLKLYLEEGYILVFQDVRGRYMSEGEYVDLRPFIADKHSPEQIDEASDAYDTIDFLVREVAGNNGRVGVYGNSYPGFYALMAAASGHPALKAASPQAPVTDWFMGDDTHHNGVLFLRDAFSFIGGSFGRPMDNPTTEAAAAPRYVRTDEYDFFLRKATVNSLTQLLGDTVRFIPITTTGGANAARCAPCTTSGRPYWSWAACSMPRIATARGRPTPRSGARVPARRAGWSPARGCTAAGGRRTAATGSARCASATRR